MTTTTIESPSHRLEQLTEVHAGHIALQIANKIMPGGPYPKGDASAFEAFVAEVTNALYEECIYRQIEPNVRQGILNAAATKPEILTTNASIRVTLDDTPWKPFFHTEGDDDGPE